MFLISPHSTFKILPDNLVNIIPSHPNAFSYAPPPIGARPSSPRDGGVSPPRGGVSPPATSLPLPFGFPGLPGHLMPQMSQFMATDLSAKSGE